MVGGTRINVGRNIGGGENHHVRRAFDVLLCTNTLLFFTGFVSEGVRKDVR